MRRIVATLSVAVVGVTTTCAIGSPAAATPVKGVSRAALVPEARPQAGERLAARLEFPTSGNVVQGRSRALKVILHNVGHNAARGVGFNIDTPEGTTVHTNSHGWSCSITRFRAGYRCSFDSPMENESTKAMRVYVRTTPDTPAGTDNITVAPFSTSGKVSTSASTSFTVVDRGDPVLLPIVQHKSAGKWATWTNGSHHTAYVNEPYTYRIVIANRGSAELDKGSSIILTQEIAPSVPVLGAKVSSGNGTCAMRLGVLHCDLTAREDIAVGRRLADVDITIGVTGASEHLPVGAAYVTNPASGAKHRHSVMIAAAHRPNAMQIHLDTRVQPDAGGHAEIDLRLRNKENGIRHTNYRVHSRIPAEFTFTGVTGTNWECVMKGAYLQCDYGAVLTKNSDSSTARISFDVSRKATVGGDGYELDFRSLHAVARAHVQVLPALVVNAVAFPTSITSSSNSRRNMIMLSAEDSVLNGTALGHTWVQRCTTLSDTRTYKGCTKGIVTPKANIAYSSHTRTHAFLPDVDADTTFVFEFIAQNDSTEAHRTVKVRSRAGHASTASFEAPETPEGAVSAQGVSSYGTLPTWFTDTTDGGRLKILTWTNSSGVISATAQLPLNMKSQLNVGDTAPVNVTAYENDASKCVVVHVGNSTGTANAFNITTVGYKGKYLDIILTKTTCSYQNTTYTTNSMIVHGALFGSDMTFSGPIQVWPTYKFTGTSIIQSLNLGAADNAFVLKNVSSTLTVDESTTAATLSLGTTVSVFGLDLKFYGSVSAPSNPAGGFLEGMQVQLGMALPQTLTAGEVKIKDLSIALGIRWTPILSNRADGSMLQNYYFSITGTGTMEFLGTTLKVSQIEADYRGGILNDVIFKFSADLALKGMKKVHGDLQIMWQAALPAEPAPADAKPGTKGKDAVAAYWAVDAQVVIETDSGFAIGTPNDPARISYRNACVKVSGRVIVPGILDATVEGTFVTAFPCFPTAGDFVHSANNLEKRSIFDKLPIPVIAGDWRFDATDVKITLGGFSMTGDFAIGRMAEVPYGALDATVHLTRSDTKNTIYVEGELNPLLLTAKLKGTGNLSVAGVAADFSIDAKLTPLSQYIEATASMNFGGTTVAVSGQFGLDKKTGIPYSSYSGSVSHLKIDGFDLGSATVSWYESPSGAGYTASVKMNLGVINLDGTLVVNATKAGLGFSLNADGDIKVSDQWDADLSFAMTNCTVADCTSLGSFKVSASGSATLGGKVFHLPSFDFDTGGHFRFHAKYSGDGCENTGNIEDLGIEFEGCFGYDLDALLTDQAPYLDIDADVSLEIKSRTRNTVKHEWHHWHSWGSFNSGFDVKLDPFRVSFRIDLGVKKWTFNI